MWNDNKVSFLGSLAPVSPKDIITGIYDGYEDQVEKEGGGPPFLPTFARVELKMRQDADDRRLQNTTFVLTSGKKMGVRESYIKLYFHSSSSSSLRGNEHKCSAGRAPPLLGFEESECWPEFVHFHIQGGGGGLGTSPSPPSITVATREGVAKKAWEAGTTKGWGEYREEQKASAPSQPAAEGPEHLSHQQAQSTTASSSSSSSSSSSGDQQVRRHFVLRKPGRGAYDHLITAIVREDKASFPSTRSLLASWEVWDPVINQAEQNSMTHIRYSPDFFDNSEELQRRQHQRDEL